MDARMLISKATLSLLLLFDNIFQKETKNNIVQFSNCFSFLLVICIIFINYDYFVYLNGHKCEFFKS